MVSLLSHGGQTRDMLTIEIGRTEVRRITLYDSDKVLQLVAKWLRENGVGCTPRIRIDRRFLEEPQLNEIAQRRNATDADVFDLIFTVRRLRHDLEVAQGIRKAHQTTMQTIVLGLKDAIVAHGPVTPEYVSSAAKRVYGRLRGIRGLG